MTKHQKNSNEEVFLKIDATPYLWEHSGRLYFWDIDSACYEWSGETEYWVESTLFDYNWYWYEGTAPDQAVTLEDATARFPSAFPIRVLTSKRKSARRARILRAERIANTDKQVFDEPVGLPRGFGFTDKPKHRSSRIRQIPIPTVQRAFIWKLGRFTSVPTGMRSEV